MENFEKNAIKIDSYLYGKMSGRQEEAFMKELGEKEDLRNQYEDELLLRALFRNEKKEVTLEEKKRTPIIALFVNHRSIAAAALVIIASIAVFLIAVNKRSSSEIVTAKNNTIKNNSAINAPATGHNLVVDTFLKQNIKNNSHSNALAAMQNISADTIFKEYYKQHSGDKDPIEISNYYAAYRNGDYHKVLAATDADYQTMGFNNSNMGHNGMTNTGYETAAPNNHKVGHRGEAKMHSQTMEVNDRMELLKQYMYLYKGLSFLEKNKPDSAINQFDFILQSAGDSSPQYYEAQWYNMLSFLKKNDLKTASEKAKLIRNTSSPYRNKAATIAEELKKSK